MKRATPGDWLTLFAIIAIVWIATFYVVLILTGAA